MVDTDSNAGRMVVLVVVAALSMPAVAFAATYRVAPPPAGDDAADGSDAAPWATLQHAADSVAAGDEVVVADGSYAGFVLTASGTEAAPIVFRAEEDAAVIDAPPVPDGPGVWLQGDGFVTVEGFVVTGVPAAGIRVARAGGGQAQGVILRGNKVVDSGGDAGAACIEIVEADGATIEAGVLHGCGGAGVSLGPVDSTVVRNNVIYGTAGGGIVAEGGDRIPGPDGLVVVNNTVSLPESGGWALRLAANGGIGTDNVAFDNILLSADLAAGSVALEGDVGFASARNAVGDRMSTDGGATLVTLARFQAEGYELGSFVTEPDRLFVGAATDDYRIRAGCPAIDAGLAELNGHPAAEVDLRGTHRPVGASWDLGAYEFCAGWTCDGGDADAGADVGGDDGGGDADAGSGGDGGGCACRLAGGEDAGWMAVPLAIGFAVVMRRRRARSGKEPPMDTDGHR
ncbi:MAG: right-handed parallel beta-helix repeat-containing protein [Deltaproteobacteria bacterium]|nr:right-handed parallel beta-helix repeat-containing protein [Deltaproteobacteria bacterium]